MSGGSHNNVFCMIEDYLCSQMHDPELNDLMQDIAVLAHDLEWYDSGDINEEKYKASVRRFKEKWFNSSHEERLKKYIDDALEKQKSELYSMIGVKEANNV